jgi:penicillin G amidase
MKQVDQTVAAAPTRKGRTRSGRILRFILAGVGLLFALLFVLIAAGIFWLGIRPLPQTDGTIQVAGLSAPVTVTRDKGGVAHISAQTEADLFFAQGFVTAQDRLWQMDFNRRVGSGRLSEVLGEASIKEDRFLRTIGLRRAAEIELAKVAPADLQILEYYAKGVNAYIENRKDNLPIEFTLLGYKPEPWTPLDSLTWGKVMSYDLGSNYSREILRASLIEKFGAEQAQFMLPFGPNAGSPLIVPTGVSYKGMEEALNLVKIHEGIGALTGDLTSRGSNNWVVAGQKSSTGKPILANDPHLRVSNPAVWYQVALTGGGWNVAGVTFPGVPGVVAGHNERIAWGVTNVEGDTQDLYMEKINPANPNQYEFQGQWQDMTVKQEELKIKGKPSETLTVRITRHGPILNNVVESIQQNPQQMAVRWVALEDAPLVSAVFRYNRARNWQEFREALRGFSTPAQNFVYADVDGNIGYQIPGYWPKRAQNHTGLVPVPGWTGEYEWQGYVPFEDLPSVYNPAAGYVATANNRPVAPNSKVYFGEEFDPGYRAARIVQLLEEKPQLSMDDMRRIQTDVYSIPGKEVAGYFANLPNPEPKIAEAVKRLKEWDGRLTADSVGGAIYKASYLQMLEGMFKERLGGSYENYSNERFHLLFFLRLLKDPTNPFWGQGGRDTALKTALGKGVDYLNANIGSNVADWQWGRLHFMDFKHNPLGDGVPGFLKFLVNQKSVPTGGDGTTVAAAGHQFFRPFAQRSGAVYRGIYSLQNWDDSCIMVTPGQSAQNFSSFWGDSIDKWVGGTYNRLPFSPAAVDANKSRVLTLKP